MDKRKRLLLIFMRNPEFGKCKTRLAAAIGKKAALRIYEFLLEHTESICRNLDVDKRVCYSEYVVPDDIWNHAVFQKTVQKGEDLGQRMDRAFRTGFSDGYKEIILIGTDMYDLSQADLEWAFQQLESCDYVLGPAEDGGYYLLGMKAPEARLFQNKTWGSSTVLEDTLADLTGERVCLLPRKNDIDTYEDIRDRPEFLPFLKNSES